MNEETQKPWQHGFNINRLRELEARFARFNSYALGPFTEMKKHTIAAALHNKTLEINDDFIIEHAIAKTSVDITAYLDVVIARKQKGDRVVSAFAVAHEERASDQLKRRRLVERLKKFEEPTWLWIWQEDPQQVEIAKLAGFRFIASKITSFSEIRGLYFNDKGDELVARDFPELKPVEFVGVERVARGLDVSDAVDQLKSLDVDWTNHYSNYNKDKSWSALSLRGYSADPSFIIKPSEMPGKWQQEHADSKFELQDTRLRAQLNAVDYLQSLLTRDSNVHRIRLMRLAPGGGELARHTDQVDKDSGVEDGKLMRFHIPLITNSEVFFTSWDMFGEARTVNMRVGDAWYLDTRKPHRAINKGDTDRIHLVVDVEANDAIRGLVI